MQNTNDHDTYYKLRSEWFYYKKVQEILSEITFSSIIDIGCRKSPILENIDNSVYKSMLDIAPIKPRPNINNITADFYTWEPDMKYDVAVCLQVLEHLDRPKDFVQKLFSVADIIIISVPYKWPKGACKYHIQDPVDEEKVLSWTDRQPDEKYIVKDNKYRLICRYNIKHRKNINKMALVKKHKI
jgi:2-polyprenyl-3-methyl-5-hydroxy-6-metoxy-1,4-benzoquinol methylase